MTNADNMFYSLGYEKEEIKNGYDKVVAIYYDDQRNTSIDFYLEPKTMEIVGEVNLLDLKAINEKVKELGWYD